MPAPIFTAIGERGQVEQLDLERTFNMGIGMIAVVAPTDADAAIDLLAQRGVRAWACGTVRARQANEQGDSEAKGGTGGAVTLVGAHRE